MQTLTKRQAQVLAYVQCYIDNHGYAPTLAEIGSALGLSSLATVHKHLENLRYKGRIRRDWNRSRSMTPANTCPSCGRELEAKA